MHIRS